MPVRAPFSGTVVAREAVAGTRVEPGTELFRVADLSEMWMKLAIPEKLLANLREGSTVDVRFEAYPDTTFTGALTWIGYQVDPETRLVEARAVLANQHGLLRSGMFGEASPARATRLAGLAVPESAVQEIDGRDVVFAQLQSDLFEARVIQKGATESGRTTVLAGLDKDDAIALSGGYILKSEFMKSKFGAGCADH
jgi:cobalt-zinc-cadmium efflux system membrane fusion protein